MSAPINSRDISKESSTRYDNPVTDTSAGQEAKSKSLRRDVQADSGKSSSTSSGDGDDSEKVIIVDWEGPDDPESPKNWTFRRKWAATAVTSGFNFITPLSSTMLAPVSGQIAHDFGIRSDLVVAMCTSIFVLAFAFGPLFFAPQSEIFGRNRVLQLANLFFMIFNLACGFAKNTRQLIVFRFFSGLGASAPFAVAGGVIGDCWRAEERGKAIAVYTLAPLLGPVVGPVAGAWIGTRTTWRWVLWAVSIGCAVIQCLGLYFLQETFAPVLLERKAAEIRKSMGLTKEEGKKRVRTTFDNGNRHWRAIFGMALTRPFALFVREPIVQLLGIYMAFLYGIMFLVLTTIPTIFQQVYHQSEGIVSLHYIALGLGLGVAAQTNARILDKVYKYYTAKNGGVGKPEFRLPVMYPGTTLLPVGLLIFGWSAEKHVFWIVPDIGIALIGAGTILCFQAIQTYVIDAFTLHAASALAAVTFLRSVCGFGFPLFAPAMYKRFGIRCGRFDARCAGYCYWVSCTILILEVRRKDKATQQIFWRKASFEATCLSTGT